MIILSFLPLMLAGLVSVWILGLAGKWTLRIRVSLKLRWFYFGLLMIISIVNILANRFIGSSGSVILGVAAQVVFGAWFFGRFAIRGSSQSANFMGGLKMVGAATAILLLAGGFMFAATSLLIPRTPGG